LLGVLRWLTVACCFWLLAPPALQAQYPRARRGQFEVSGLDFRPDGGWRRRVAAIRTARHQWLRAGKLSALNLSGPAGPGGGKVVGRVIVPVIPIAFRNVAPPFPAARYNDVFFSPNPSGRPYSVKTFYEQLSNRNITIDGRIFDWVVADSDDSYYEDGCNGIGVLAPCPVRPVNRFGELLLRTLDEVSRGSSGSTVWGQFDNDGPDGVPNSGDDDGVVDFVTFLQAERDGACPNSSNVWAHRFVVRAWNGGSPYVTQTPWTAHPGQFLKVDSYTMQSAVGGNTACDAGSIMPIGTVAHETGHAFGLPDLYDTDLSNPSATQGIGEWGLMGSGNYARPHSPARFEAWSLLEMGWVTVDTLTSGRDVRLRPVATADTVLYFPVPGTDEYYLLENRQPVESDSAQMNPAFGSRQKAPGLLVWHIDQGQVDLHSFDMDNRVNSGPVHGVALAQGDGREDLGRPGGFNRGDTGDAFPGSTGNTSLCRTTSPAATDNQAGFARFCLESISQLPGGDVGFRFVSFRSVFSADHAGVLVGINGASMPRLDQFFPPGTVTEISVDSVQLDGTGRTSFEFLSWSDGGLRTHLVTSGEVPDTVIAIMAASHRLRTVVQGATAAAVVAGVAGDMSTGVYLPEGSQVSLRADPPPGAAFSSWTGDTSSTRDTLTLTMSRPFDLRANFAAFQAVVLVNAAEAILGISTLPSDQVAYLDAAGNRDGVYDVGDFLAAVDRSEAVATGSVASRPVRGGK
jgi:M6 family metalloprotease-like protein